jgi:hypothetical protein
MVRTSRIKASQNFAALAVKENQIIFSVALPPKKFFSARECLPLAGAVRAVKLTFGLRL